MAQRASEGVTATHEVCQCACRHILSVLCVLQQRQGISTGLASSVSSSRTATLTRSGSVCRCYLRLADNARAKDALRSYLPQSLITAHLPFRALAERDPQVRSCLVTRMQQVVKARQLFRYGHVLKRIRSPCSLPSPTALTPPLLQLLSPTVRTDSSRAVAGDEPAAVAEADDWHRGRARWHTHGRRRRPRRCASPLVAALAALATCVLSNRHTHGRQRRPRRCASHCCSCSACASNKTRNRTHVQQRPLYNKQRHLNRLGQLAEFEQERKQREREGCAGLRMDGGQQRRQQGHMAPQPPPPPLGAPQGGGNQQPAYGFYGPRH